MAKSLFHGAFGAQIKQGFRRHEKAAQLLLDAVGGRCDVSYCCSMNDALATKSYVRLNRVYVRSSHHFFLECVKDILKCMAGRTCRQEDLCY